MQTDLPGGSWKDDGRSGSRAKRRSRKQRGMSPTGKSHSEVVSVSLRPAGRISLPRRVIKAACGTPEVAPVFSKPDEFFVAGCTRIRTTLPFLIRFRLWSAICQKSRSSFKRIRNWASARMAQERDRRQPRPAGGQESPGPQDRTQDTEHKTQNTRHRTQDTGQPGADST